MALFGICVCVSLPLVWLRPGYALGPVLMLFGIQQFFQTRAAFFVTNSGVVSVAIAGIAAVAACRVFLQRPRLPIYTSAHLISYMLIGMAFVSYSWTMAPTEFRRVFVNAVPYFILFVVIAPILLRDRQSIRDGIVAALWIGIALLFGYTLLCDWEARGLLLAAPLMTSTGLRWSTTPLSLAVAASYAAIASILMLPRNALLRAVQLVGFATGCYVVILTQTRGQAIALAFVTTMCIPLSAVVAGKKSVMVALLASLLIAAVLIIAFLVLSDNSMSRWEDDRIEGGVEVRVILIRALLHTWADGTWFNIVFGLGAMSSYSTSGVYVHNLPAEILGEYGLCGALLATALTGITFARICYIVKRFWSGTGGGNEVLVLIAFLIFRALLSLKQGSLYSSGDLLFLSIAVNRAALLVRASPGVPARRSLHAVDKHCP